MTTHDRCFMNEFNLCQDDCKCETTFTTITTNSKYIEMLSDEFEEINND